VVACQDGELSGGAEDKRVIHESHAALRRKQNHSYARIVVIDVTLETASLSKVEFNSRFKIASKVVFAVRFYQSASDYGDDICAKLEN
jgi:hypothetical protein